MRRTIFVLAALVAAVAVGAAAAHAPTASKITIRHQMRGCHTWSVDGGAWRTALRTTLARGGTIAFKNVDIMPHTLVKTSGPAWKVVHGKLRMNHMGATVKVKFLKSGVYKLKTRPGEDYPGMDMHTIGEDYHLTLTVRVS